MRLEGHSVTGHRVTLRFTDDATTITLTLPDYEADKMITALLLSMATANPVRWQAAFDAVRQ